MERSIIPYRQKMESSMNKVVGFSAAEVRKSKPSGPLNNLVADMVFTSFSEANEYPVDFCVLNYGGLRRPIPQGKILKADVYQLMPFENEAVIVKLRPQAMKKLIRYMYLSEGQPVSGLHLVYKDSLASLVEIKGEAWDSTRSYYVLTSDYSANGGDRMDFFMERDTLFPSGMLLRDVIFEYLQKHPSFDEPLVADTVARIIFTKNYLNKHE
jgi:2',3'-cyclic-nucleotide 2'-phosphodiesterase (5'-nucleotidase family)